MAFASTSTGPIQKIRINTGTNNSPRVSIFLGQTTACSTQGWYAYQAAASGVGLVRTQGLLAAYNAGNNVTIVGTGTCDAFQVERIQDIDLLP
jgi:hypothetical protein